MKVLEIYQVVKIYPLFDSLPRFLLRYQAHSIQTFYLTICQCFFIRHLKFKLVLILFGGIYGFLIVIEDMDHDLFLHNYPIEKCVHLSSV